MFRRSSTGEESELLEVFISTARRDGTNELCCEDGHYSVIDLKFEPLSDQTLVYVVVGQSRTWECLVLSRLPSSIIFIDDRSPDAADLS
ncbi:hypothetical protein J6590_005454 [Homalodisca vitripennis]|nr:hypothetical protein J6590_005454 [Homalodisca vitripennis]